MKEEVIQSYHAVIDWRTLGFNSLRIYIKWQNISLESEQEIYEFLRKDSLFMWTVKFEGEMDIGVYVWVKEVPEFSEKWFAFLAKYRRYILKYEVYESVEMIHYPFKFLVERKVGEEVILGSGKKEEYDETDYEILKSLTENAQMPITEIATRVNLTPKGTVYRLRQLEKKGIILGYFALIDTEKLGMEFYKVDFYLNNVSRLKEMEEYAKQHRNIVYRMKTIGGPDFEIEIVVENAIEMKKIVDSIRKRFSGTIHSYRFHRFEYTIKQVYLPQEPSQKGKV